jgi:hypothetical protein
LAQGVYDIIVRDASGCTYEYQDVTIGRDNTINLAVGSIYIVSQPTCSDPSGSIQVEVTGGSGAYEYALNGNIGYAPLDPSGIIDGLSAGTYKVSIQDANAPVCGTAISEAITLKAVDSDLSVTATVTTESGDCDMPNGAITVVVTGGTPSYEYTLNGNVATPSSFGVINSLKPGTYVIDVTDAAGCVASSGEVLLTASNGGLEVLVSSVSNASCEESNGSFKLTVTPGTPSYLYQIDGFTQQIMLTDNVTITGLAAGNHTWIVTDATGCVATGRQTITNSGTNSLSIVASKATNAQCDGTIGGSIAITVSNGVAPFEYSIDGVNFIPFTSATATTETISNLSQGVYDVIVRDNQSCTYEYQDVVIGRDNMLNLVVASIYIASQPSCASTTGSIKVEVAGGSGDYEYALNGDILYDDLTDGLISGLSAGTYVVSVRDKNAPLCGTATSEALTLNPDDTDLRLILTPTSAASCGTTNGYITMTITGGTTPYQYSIDGGTYTALPADNKITGLKPGLYIVNVKDNNSCIVSGGQVEVEAENGGLAVVVGSTTNTTCGDASGSFILTVNSGTTPYTYYVDGGVTQTMAFNSATIAGLTAGVHSWHVADAECFAEGTVTIINDSPNSLAFTVVATDVQCDGSLGSIAISVTSGLSPYSYSYDGGTKWTTFAGSTTTIVDLTQGSYDVKVKDNFGCMYEYQNIIIDQRKIITPPSAVSPQTFCSGATVENLQATGVGIKWYNENGDLLPTSTTLVDGTIYYAAQSTGSSCESMTRTPVKAIIDNDVVLDMPRITSPQSFCEPATLANVATNGNTNIVWFDAATLGNTLPLETPLVNGASYYAATSAGGSCVSIARKEVEVTITTVSPNEPDVMTPQSFCDGATLANITVPNNQILWYAASTGGTALAPTTTLVDGVTYYAAQSAGSCESTSRVGVTISLNQYPEPVSPGTHAVCSGSGTLADIKITGAGIVWYDAQTAGNQLPLSTALVDGVTYYAAQSSGDCESDRIAVTVTTDCFTVYGTMFPFVYEEGEDEFNALFPVIVKLHQVPGLDSYDPIGEMYEIEPVHITQAVYYDGSFYFSGIPKNPGTIGVANNPGLPISWAAYLNKNVGSVDQTTLSQQWELPTKPIGMYKFEKVAPGDYILEINRPGFLTRFGMITVSASGEIGHRELLAGDCDGDLEVTRSDLSNISRRISFFGSPLYSPFFDFDGNAMINMDDKRPLIFDLDANVYIYEETELWISIYY